MKKVVRFLLIITSFVTIAFSFCAYRLHTLAVEGNEIFNKRCTEVNPLLIGYKNSFLNLAGYLKSPKSYKDGEIKTFWESYISGMRSYVDRETNWLDVQRKYLDRWDFRLLEPYYFKNVAEYQWKMYEGYRDEAKYMVATFENKEEQEEVGDKFAEARQRRVNYEDQYFKLFDEAVLIEDWRKRLSEVPPPEGCTEENMTIPDTSGSIDWEGTQSSSPTPVQIDTDITS